MEQAAWLTGGLCLIGKAINYQFMQALGKSDQGVGVGLGGWVGVGVGGG